MRRIPSRTRRDSDGEPLWLSSRGAIRGAAFTVISVGDRMDNLFEYLRDTLGPRQAAIEDVQRKVANGGTPYGVLSALGGRPYAAMFLGHGAGRLPIYPANREVALREREVAKAALGRTVVVDPTTLVVASFTDGLFQLLQGEFQSLTTTDAAVADVVATMEHNARGDGLTIGWDNALGQAVVNQEDPDSLSERRRRARVSADWARNDSAGCLAGAAGLSDSCGRADPRQRLPFLELVVGPRLRQGQRPAVPM
jgi:hypothetical protein